jgi:hypothetical protein
MILAAISFEGPEFIYILEEKENADAYKDILKKCISKVTKLSEGELICIQNKSPSHGAINVKEFLE